MSSDSCSDFAPSPKVSQIALDLWQKKQKVIAPRKKKKTAVSATPSEFSDSDSENIAPLRKTTTMTTTVATAAGSKKSIEDIYQKKSQLEHVLLRPDTYIGSPEPITQEMYVFSGGKIVKKSITFSPGFYKIFDEILVNAADNKLRDPSMDSLKVHITETQISVWNNGRGIPIELHKKEGVYVPELIFGHLLTSSNYDDTEKKVVGGRNGYGAKLCNIFSREFIVETADRKKKYKQVFSDNMGKKTEPTIGSSSQEFTKITFKPDFQRFQMEKIDDDTRSLLAKRVYDLAGVVQGIKVYLNDERVTVKNFKQYCELYFPESDDKRTLVHERVNERWEVAVALSEGQFEQISFVNSICTFKGGNHVSYVVDQLVSKLQEVVKKKNKNQTVKPFQIKNHLTIFLNCLIENPSFDSQTKENMTLKVSSFGSKCVVSDEYMNRAKKLGIVESILDTVRIKQDQMLKKTDGTKRARIHISKLDDANNAGTRKAKDCILILTEGDSAKTLAVSGLGVVGRDNYGVFPLRGKLLNVREASHKQILDNQEITSLKQIMGLQTGRKYESADGLRYGHICIMADQDHDGSHIKGLIINLFDHFWPGLLKLDGFLLEFITPIVRVKKGKEDVSFFTLPEYENWKESQGSLKGWDIKYYKGLGTSTKQDAKQYFSNLKRHLKQFKRIDDEDRSAIDMAFSKKKADLRKEWLREYEPGTHLDHDQPKIKVKEFIDKELILFSMADNIRSIPSMVDGMKPGLRKILFACFKRNLTKDIKVAQLSGYVAEHSAYHHGEQSLQSSIIGLAQNFIGSNNINLLEPLGQFGSRLQGGKDHASPRYIFTKLTKLARVLYDARDDALLDYLNDDGQDIEPKWYAPILPMVLVNGTEGIGTGWSSSIPNYNPKDLVRNLKRLLEGKEQEELHPWFRGHTGLLECLGHGKYVSYGNIKIEDDTTVAVDELPVRVWTQSYKEYLESLVEAQAIKDFKEFHTDSKVAFKIYLNEPLSPSEIEDESLLLKRFKLTNSISASNMVCFDQEQRIKKYGKAEDILEEFFTLRLKYYQKRKEYLVNKLMDELDVLKNKCRFIKMVIASELEIRNKKKNDLMKELARLEFKPQGEGSYDYLLGMSIWTLTFEKYEEMRKQEEKKCEELDLLMSKSAKQLWTDDLGEFEREYDSYMKDLEHLEGARREREIRVNLTAPKEKKVRAPKKPSSPIVEDTPVVDDMMIDMSSKPSPPPVKRPVPKNTGATAAQKKVVKQVAKKIETIELSSDSDESVVAVPVEKTIAANKPRRTVKKVQRQVSESESEEEGEDFDETNESDGYSMESDTDFE